MQAPHHCNIDVIKLLTGFPESEPQAGLVWPASSTVLSRYKKRWRLKELAPLPHAGPTAGHTVRPYPTSPFIEPLQCVRTSTESSAILLHVTPFYCFSCIESKDQETQRSQRAISCDIVDTSQELKGLMIAYATTAMQTAYALAALKCGMAERHFLLSLTSDQEAL